MPEEQYVEKTMNEELILNLRSLTRFIYYVTPDEGTFILDLKTILSRRIHCVWVFHPEYGSIMLKDYIDALKKPNHLERKSKKQDIYEFLKQARNDDPRDEQNFYVILNADRYLTDPRAVRLIQDIIVHGQADIQTIKMLLFTSASQVVLPEELRRYTAIIDRGPNEARVVEYVTYMAQALHRPVPEDIYRKYQGLSVYELEMVCALSVIATKNTSVRYSGVLDDPETLRRFRRSRGLPIEGVDTPEDQDATVELRREG